MGPRLELLSGGGGVASGSWAEVGSLVPSLTFTAASFCLLGPAGSRAPSENECSPGGLSETLGRSLYRPPEAFLCTGRGGPRAQEAAEVQKAQSEAGPGERSPERREAEEAFTARWGGTGPGSQLSRDSGGHRAISTVTVRRGPRMGLACVSRQPWGPGQGGDSVSLVFWHKRSSRT